MKTRKLGPFNVSELGLGCMSMSHAYGHPSAEKGKATLLRALDLGYTFLDTAALYGFGENEKLLGEVVSSRRNEFVLASKCGLGKGPDGKRGVNGRPEVLRHTCETSLKNLKTDVIDLYYLHRVDPNVPMEDQIGTLSDLVKEGKIQTIGMSEVNANTLRKAHAIHPITALQSEYSLWTRNPEGSVLDTCKELGVAFVAFSPLARAFFTGKLRDMSLLPESDIRHNMPRFIGDDFEQNLKLLPEYEAIAEEVGCTPAQLALAWLLAQDDNIIPIPGTQHVSFLEENTKASDVHLSEAVVERLNELINPNTVHGERYNATIMATMET